MTGSEARPENNVNLDFPRLARQLQVERDFLRSTLFTRTPTIRTLGNQLGNFIDTARGPYQGSIMGRVHDPRRSPKL